MSDTVPLSAKFLLFSTLIASGQLQAANEAQRWRCEIGPQGDWQCGAIAPTTGLGKQFVAPARPTAQAATVAPAAAGAEKPSAAEPAYTLDWVPRGEQTPQQLELTPGYCTGRYIEPSYVDEALLSVAPETQPLKGSARSSQTAQSGITTLSGDVVIRQGYRQIKSDEAVLDREAGTADFPGRAQFREPGILLIGEDTHVNLTSEQVSLHNAEFVAHQSHMRGTAENLRRRSDGVVEIERGMLTYCAPGANAWSVVGSELELNRETGVGTVKHARLRVKDVPVLYVPYLQFPIDDRRKSGFLMPNIGTSDGFDVATPYYLNIAPNYDATLTPRYIGDRGVMGEAEFRYLHDQNEGEVGGAYLVNDDLFDGEDRWLGFMTHDGRLFDRIRTRVDYTAASDEDYFSDLGTDLNATSRVHLLRLGEARFNSRFWDVTTRLQGYQTLDENILDANKPYDRLPQIKLQGLYPHEASGLEFGLLSEYTYFDRDNSDLTGLDRATGHRMRLQPSVSWLFDTPYAFLRPSLTYKYAHYTLEDLDAGFNDNPEIAAPVFSFDSGLFFERDAGWGDRALLQTFEPRLFYLKVPEDEEQQEIPDFDTRELDFSYSQLFREDRFVGGDRVGDADQLSLGLTTRFLETDGFERLRASIGQIYYFEDREVTLTGTQDRRDRTSESALAAELMFALQSGWRLQGDVEWDPDIERTNQSSLYLRYHGDNRHLFNIGYRVRNDDREQLEQTDVSLVWPLGERWSFISRWNQDLINDRIIEAFAGLEYQSCCWSVRVVGRHWINDDNLTSSEGVDAKDAIYIQFLLKGLGNIGDSTESLFSDSIPGYEEP